MPPDNANRTVVIGLDGATFELIDPWLAAGDLPAIRTLLNGGVSGELKSVLPPVTSPNWKAYSTGKNPGKLGIFWWFNVDTENERTYCPTDRYHTNTEFWELLAEDEAVGVFGMPMTYPPKSVGEFVVASAPDADDTGFAYPGGLEDELREDFGYSPGREYLIRNQSIEAVEEIIDLIDATFTASKALMDRYDVTFLQVTTYYLNLLQHALWDHDYTHQAWKLIDDHIEAFLDEETNVVLMSDHGMMEIQTVFNINQWLRREGYLSHDSTTSETLHRAGITSDRLKQWLKRVNRTMPAFDLNRVVERYVPQRFIENLPDKTGELGASKHSQINWDETGVLASAIGPIYLTMDAEDPQYDPLREELVTRFEQLTTPDGRPVFDGVYRAESVYDGLYVDEGPDILIDQAPGVYVHEGIGSPDDPVFKDEDKTWRAINARNGLFAAYGPDFTEGTADGLSILDLAPTLLHLHGRVIPGDMDGEVRTDLFSDWSERKMHEPRYESVQDQHGGSPTTATDDEMRARLEDLGYL